MLSLIAAPSFDRLRMTLGGPAVSPRRPSSFDCAQDDITALRMTLAYQSDTGVAVKAGWEVPQEPLTNMQAPPAMTPLSLMSFAKSR